MSELLKWHHATVTICHSKTRDLDKIVSEADILVVGIGSPHFVKVGRLGATSGLCYKLAIGNFVRATSMNNMVNDLLDLSLLQVHLKQSSFTYSVLAKPLVQSFAFTQILNFRFSGCYYLII